jgi:hypothetical protein
MPYCAWLAWSRYRMVIPCGTKMIKPGRLWIRPATYRLRFRLQDVSNITNPEARGYREEVA